MNTVHDSLLNEKKLLRICVDDFYIDFFYKILNFEFHMGT